MRPSSGDPTPQISFTASAAIIEPTWPVRAPRTPASPQLGTVPGRGGVGNRSRRSVPGKPAGGADQNTETCAWVR